MKRLVLAVSLLVLSACTHKEPNFIYMPDMVYSPALKAQEEGSMRLPPEGTVPRGFTSHPYGKSVEDGDRAGREIALNPIKATFSVLKRGQDRYNTYCMVCHGPAGEGDGSVVPQFPRPPTLQSDKVRGWTDGRIFHVVTRGQNLMPAYASQIPVSDRWAIVHYVRALQKSKKPSEEDVRKAEKLVSLGKEE